MTSDRRFFSGDSLAQALNQAAQQFQVAPAELDYKVVEKRHGFLKIRRKVLIEIDASAPLKAPAASKAPAVPEAPAAPEAPAVSEAPEAQHVATEPDVWTVPEAPAMSEAPAEPPVLTVSEARQEPAAPSEEAETVEPEAESTEPPKRAAEGRVELPEAPPPARARFQVAEGEEAEAAGDALDRILALAALDLESEILQADEELLVELWGEDQDILLRDRGRLLLAIQHLLPRAIRGLLGRSAACKVDSDDFHMIREERLRDMAQRAADEVRHKGRPRTLEPMSPDERRIVHLTLADYPGVETESHGSGLFKRVMVRASRDEGSRGRGPYRR